MPTITIVGASARAAAASARRAGITPWCADLFGDADLRAMVPDAVRCPAGEYPRGLLDILHDAPDCPWLYTGGLENHPNLVRRMAAIRPLWGNGANALASSRSPFVVERILREEGLPGPEARAADAELPDYCRWLRKPLRGSAGQGISFAEPTHRDETTSPAHYYQQFVEGDAMSAVFVRAREEVRLLGVTEQLIGESWLNAPPFRYAGSIGPIQVNDDLRHDLLRIGRALGERCGLLGLFGVDFILHDGRPWVVEVNPRYTASIEVLERASGTAVLGFHCTAFDPEATTPVQYTSLACVAGKAILYAPRRVVMPSYDVGGYLDVFGGEIRAAGHFSGVNFADIPHPGEVIDESWPILTCYGEGASRTECLRHLRARAMQAISLVYEYRFPRYERTTSWYARIDDSEAS